MAHRVERDCLGRRVRLDLPRIDYGEPATSHITLRIDGVDREITTGPLSTARSIMHEVPVIDAVDERYEMAGGTLHVGSKVEAASGGRVLARTAAGAWEGEMYSVYAFVTGAGVDGHAIVDLFRALRIRERVDGVSVRVRRGRGGTIVEEPTVAVEQTHLGLLEISQMTWRTQRGLPRWKGSRARGGELFRDQVGDQIEYLRLVNESSLTTIQPRNGRRFDGDELDLIIDELEVGYVDNGDMTATEDTTGEPTPEPRGIEGDIDELEGLSVEQRRQLRERRQSGRRQLRKLERDRARRRGRR